MQITDIITQIEKTAPLPAAASWDCSGMQVASLRTDITTLAVCLDPSPESVRKALELKAGCILSHHPLLMQGRLPSRLDAYNMVLRELFCHDVALYAAHTSLDANPQGPASWLARELSLRDCALLEETFSDSAHTYGFGCAGTLPQPLAFQELCHKLATYISLDTAVFCGQPPATIKRLAYCTGSGSSLTKAAQKAKADIFITGDVKYHTALETELCILDAGHHSLEEEMMRRFAHELQESLADVHVHFIPSASPFTACLPH